MNKNLIYDVGMHKGEDTDYYLKKGFDVVAFEANPEMVHVCRERFRKEINEGRLIIVEGAIVDFGELANKEIKTVHFYKNTDVSVWGTVASDWAERNEKLGTHSEKIEVPAVNFTDCLAKYGIPYYLKIDIEGMDIVCLKSLLHFTDKPDYISIESEKKSFRKLKKEFDLFKANGYDSFQLVNQADIQLQKEPRPSKENKFTDYTFEHGSSGLFGKDLTGHWYSCKRAIRKYRCIFAGYKLLGDTGVITNRYLKAIILRLIGVFTKRPVPGWYDTHARHSTVTKNSL